MMDEIEIPPYETMTLPGNRLKVYHDGDEESFVREVFFSDEDCAYWEFGPTSGSWRVTPMT